jgi:hypothetical protein
MESIAIKHTAKAGLLVAAMLLLSAAADQASGQMVSVDPAISQPAQENFTIDVVMNTGGLSVLGMEIKLNFVSSIVQIDSIVPGDWVVSTGYEYFFWDHAPSGPGYQAHFAMACLDGTLNGSGAVATLHFSALTAGVTP